jgi:hypothetical protein
MKRDLTFEVTYKHSPEKVWRGVKFAEPPKELPWGAQAVFKDLYGNSYALVQNRAASASH